MKVRLYDLKHAPFSQGHAVMEIMRNIGGKLLAAGDVESPPIELEEKHGHGGGLIYVRSERGGGIGQSIWFDDGCSVCCQAFKLGDGEWTRTNISNTLKGVVVK